MFKALFVFSTHILTRRMTSSFIVLISVGTFQLTSSQGGWQYPMTTGERVKVFNSHPHKEDDHVLPLHMRSKLFFNSHPHKEDDEKSTIQTTRLQVFQLTSSQGGWHDRSSSFRSSHRFSTHILTRRMTMNIETQEEIEFFQLTSSQGGWPRPLLLFLA